MKFDTLMKFHSTVIIEIQHSYYIICHIAVLHSIDL